MFIDDISEHKSYCI